MICGGDWNLVLDEKDKKGGSTKLSHTKNREKLKSFIDRNNLTDVWRTLNPEIERYTWRQKTPNIQCRLDFFPHINWLTECSKQCRYYIWL